MPQSFTAFVTPGIMAENHQCAWKAAIPAANWSGGVIMSDLMDSLDKPLFQILVADDSPVFREMLQRMLREWGYNVIAVTDGHQAWEILRQKDGPRLALLDWMM